METRNENTNKIKSRDVKFYEKLHSSNDDWDDSIKILDNSNNSNGEEASKTKLPSLMDLHNSEDEDNQQLEVDDVQSEITDVHGNDEEDEEHENRLQRGRGRPKLLKTGKAGRPKKIYQQCKNTNHSTYKPMGF